MSTPYVFWRPNHVYPANSYVFDGTGNIQLTTAGGTSGANAPAWTTTTTSDGTITWSFVGYGAKALEYLVSSPLASGLVEESNDAVSFSRGPGDAGKFVLLDSSGQLDPSMGGGGGGGGNVNWRGTWSSITSYNFYDMVEYSGATYLSLIPLNMGNTPSTSPSDWEPIGQAPGTANFGTLASGTNTTAAMDVGTGASLFATGTGVIDATEINGVPITGTPSLGKIPIGQGTDAVWADPFVQGVYAPGVNVLTAFGGNPIQPVLVGAQAPGPGNALTNLRTDASGNLYVWVQNATSSTANQGNQGTIGQSWFVELTDGTNVIGVSAHPLYVQGTISVSGTVTSNIQASSVPLTATGSSLNVNITGGASSDAQYPDGTTNATPTGTVAMGKNPGNVLHALALDSSGNLFVNIAASTSLSVTQGTSPWVVSLASTTITGTVAVTQSTTPWTIQGDGAAGSNLAGNPVLIAGSDYGSPAKTQYLKVDASGNIYIGNTSIPVTQSGVWNVSQSGVWSVNSVQSGTWVVGQGTPPWSFNLTQLNSVALGSPSNYGTSPGAVEVIGVNAFITNTVTIAGTVTANQGGTWSVQQGTTPWVDNVTQWASTTLGAPTAFGTAPSGNVIGVNAEMFAGATALTATGSSLNVNVTGGGSSGTQYADGTAVGTPTGTAALGFDGTDVWTLRLDGAKNLYVNLHTALPTGANTIGAVTQASGPWTINTTQWNSVSLGSPTAWGTAPSGNVIGVNSEMFAGGTALSATGTSLNVNITGGGSGGTQYTEGTTVATPVGTAALGKNPSNVVETLRLDASNNLLTSVNAPLPAGTNVIGQVEVTDGAGHNLPAGDSVTRPIITEITDGTNILGTVAHPLQVAQAGGGSSVTLTPSTTFAFTRVLVNISSSGVTTLIAGIGGQTLRIYRFSLVFASTVAVTLQDTASNVLFPTTSILGNSVIEGEFDTQPKFPIVVGNGFAINLGTASVVTGFIDYTQM